MTTLCQRPGQLCFFIGPLRLPFWIFADTCPHTETVDPEKQPASSTKFNLLQTSCPTQISHLNYHLLWLLNSWFPVVSTFFPPFPMSTFLSSKPAAKQFSERHGEEFFHELFGTLELDLTGDSSIDSPLERDSAGGIFFGCGWSYCIRYSIV